MDSDNTSTEKDCRQPILTLSLTPTKAPLSLADITGNFEIIRLDANANDIPMIGSITKCWKTKEGGYLIADMELSNKIFGFDSKGNHVFSIENHGKGPGQFVSIWDAHYTPASGNIHIWDYVQRKLLTFEGKGEFLDEKKINMEIMTFYISSEKELYFHIDRRGFAGKKTPFLYSLAGALKIETPMGVWDYGIIDGQVDKLEFSAVEGALFFHKAMTDTLYTINPKNNELCRAYYLDFGGYNLKEDIKKQTDMMKFAERAMEALSSFSTGNLVVTKEARHLTWAAEIDQEDYFHYSSRENQFSFNINSKNHTLHGIPIVKVIGGTENEFIGYSYPYKINKSEWLNAAETKSFSQET